MISVTDAARAVLDCPEPMGKVRLAKACGRSVAAGTIAEIGLAAAPPRPGRPTRPRLCAPRHMARRRAAGSRAGRIALYHALAHIELNAIDLAFDLIARFADPALPWAFYAEWARIGAEEAHHFELLEGRLQAFGAAYGDLPAHDGLWEAALATSDDLLARLAVVPLVLEARGLDVTPGMITRLRGHGDGEGAAMLELILEEEIRHVAAGWRWFRWVAERRGMDPPAAWAGLVRTRYKGKIKPPFNQAARLAAGFDAGWLELVSSPDRAGTPARR
ncbi:MAG: ferritin-like domain-containing protein [Alphaproteobacteria bacterium]|nr:ferritin-like domain-containing protein [Pseudomonadota bacterium]TDI67291.1 MAG: ferritin-like domain-containing protein [Alphaproteobacteria bacterium]